MRELHCPNCGNSFVRVIYQEGMVGRLLSRVNVFPFRCQLCTNRFRAFYSGARHNTQAFDRRQYTHLTASIKAQVLDPHQPSVTNRITEISNGWLHLADDGVPERGLYRIGFEADGRGETIHIETAMVCSVRPVSMGVRFLEIPPEQYRRLAQVVLGLLFDQSLDSMLNA
jgi:hypothetical protein